MNTNTAEQIVHETPTVPGTPYDGGFCVGRFLCNGEPHLLIVAPKAAGEHDDAEWHTEYSDIAGAQSYCDGLANTQAMAEAGSELAQWALGLNIDGHADWYLPAQDELELCYRALKPTTDDNYLYGRSGINVSAAPPTYPYTADAPAQTPVEAFQVGGSEAFDEAWYWSSTQHASLSGGAWCQGFGAGGQDSSLKASQLRARAVRKIKA